LGVLVAAGAVVLAIVAFGGGGGAPKPPATKPGASATPTPAPASAPPAVKKAAKKAATVPLSTQLETRGKHLSIGITESNPNFVSTSPEVPQPFARWRDQLGRMHPELYRLIVYWPAVQPSADAPPDLAGVNGGCVRDKGPCAPYAGIRDQLRALATRQRSGGWEGFVVITGTPEWAARPPSACERRRVTPTNRMPRIDALPAYERLVTALLAEARKQGASLRYWAPWNEPNHPYSSSPQRATCSATAKPVSIQPYVAVANALRRALAAAPGIQRYTIGEVAVLTRRTSLVTTVHEFLAALPPKLVCGAAAWTQHTYIGGEDVLGDVDRLLASKGCRLAIWLTETGAGAPHSGTARTGGRASELTGCRAVQTALSAWYRDPRVTAAIQYTLREDDVFPVGLVTTDLTRAYPVLREWQQWGMTRRGNPSDPPPAKAACH
jgi:hypothetical protein